MNFDGDLFYLQKSNPYRAPSRFAQWAKNSLTLLMLAPPIGGTRKSTTIPHNTGARQSTADRVTTRTKTTDDIKPEEVTKASKVTTHRRKAAATEAAPAPTTVALTDLPKAVTTVLPYIQTTTIKTSTKNCTDLLK